MNLSSTIFSSMVSNGIKIFFCAFIVVGLVSVDSYGQNIRVGSNNTTAHPSSILELDGTLGGLEVPELSSAQIATLRTNILTLTPAEIAEALGMMVFQTDGKSGLYFFDGNEFVKYAPHGLVGTVGGSYSETFPSIFTFESTPAGLGYTTSQLGLGNYQIDFDPGNYFQNYPIITITPENQKVALSDELPVPAVTCTPSFSANCSADFNSDQVEAVRVESNVALTCGAATELQILQNGEGFLPPTGANGCDIWPFPLNWGGTGCGSGSLWMTTGIGQSPGAPNGAPSPGDYTTQLSGGPWGPVTDCILQISDPCVVQDGGGNYGKYYPDVNIAANTFCNNIYHPAGQTANQANQLTIRLGKGPNDYFEIWAESSPHWSDELAVWIDWNRDGDFTDANEALGMIDDPICSGGQGNPLSGCSGPGQFPVDAGALGTGTAGQFIVPPGAELGLTTMRIVSAWAAPSLITQPCRQSTWGETEDFVVEVYDCSVGSVIGVGTDFAYNPVVCAVEEIMQSGLDYTGFKVVCQSPTGSGVDTKIHWDATESTFY